MPKEIIVHGETFVIREGKVLTGIMDLEPDDVVRRDIAVSLHWSKGLPEVQLGIKLDVETVREQLRLIDKGEWMGEDHDPGMMVFYTGVLGRDVLQRLVRFGRKARDESYGADE